MDFSNCIPQSSPQHLDTCLLTILKSIEKDTGIELRINSAFRSVSYEVRMGRKGDSAHCLGKAVDIHCYTSRDRYAILKSALQHGVNRIGIYTSFIHLDVATCKDYKNTSVIWHG